MGKHRGASLTEEGGRKGRFGSAESRGGGQLRKIEAED